MEVTKERVRERTRTIEEGRYEVENARKRKESRKREENNEGKKIDEKKKESIETKELQEKDIKDIGDEIKTVMQGELKTLMEGELKTLMEGVSEVRESMDKGCQKWNSQIRRDNKEKFEESRHELAGGQDQRYDKNVEMTQQIVRKADIAVNQHVVTRVLNQRKGECAGDKGNYLQGRHRVFNKVYTSRNEYFFRNKLVNKT